MKTFKSLTIIFLGSFLLSCGSNSTQKKNDISIKTNAEGHAMTTDKTLELGISNPKNHEISSVEFKLDGKPVSEQVDLKTYRLGDHLIEATLNLGGDTETVTQNITILNNQTPKVYSYKIINEYPHDITSYTQGLEFYNGELYESTGQFGESKLRKVDYKTGKVLKNIDLADAYFGEGLTILDDKIYQLTWKSGTGLVYDVNTFERTGSFKYGNSKEGWGICNDGTKLYKSDGTEKIWTLNPETLTEESFIQAYHNKGKVVELNELEWVDGKIYANRYNKNGVAIINPENGAVEGVIDFTPLRKKVTQHPKLDVLNGIAYNPETKTFFITGKRWDKLFEVEIIEN
ncbi:glutaminyl-peptide cyclotransferase [Xanthomarina sp. F2636L]|uniref:glutaminyl-peptide cyclotransferase n=1 Tax=Xanthomarina sp. F2636L TaxID=2996018 RepID=UPI00225E3B39|nr:glutaminyl-peptide cyclotransferase [Xanthomarina sp. F2636L]MCX7552150.1 glutaminyl-peptide cyclotransferase [Xanthomarina sp. F2636L]